MSNGRSSTRSCVRESCSAIPPSPTRNSFLPPQLYANGELQGSVLELGNRVALAIAPFGVERVGIDVRGAAHARAFRVAGLDLAPPGVAIEEAEIGAALVHREGRHVPDIPGTEALPQHDPVTRLRHFGFPQEGPELV